MNDLTFIQPDEIEGLTIKIKIGCKLHSITSLYKPPCNTKLQKVYESLENMVNKKNAIDKNDTYEILGDFNFNLFNQAPWIFFWKQSMQWTLTYHHQTYKSNRKYKLANWQHFDKWSYKHLVLYYAQHNLRPLSCIPIKINY